MKNIVSVNLSKVVCRTIKAYNRYRGPEASAKLLELKKNGFTIEFVGPFCQSCGVQDYLEDFIYELKSLNDAIEVEIGEIEQSSPSSFSVKYIVKFFFS